MRLVIDVGNTHICLGVQRDSNWEAVFRIKTDVNATEDELASTILCLCQQQFGPHDFSQPLFDEVSIASVVPSINLTLERLSKKWLKCNPFFLVPTQNYGLEIKYETPTSIGADRIANSLAALKITKPPIVIVDFGTATTFDAIDSRGCYLGGAILPGPLLAAASLFERTAKLPQISLEAPKRAIGTNTPDAMKSGLVLGYAYGIDGLAKKMSDELGGAEVMVTGGLGPLFKGLCPQLGEFYPHLTLDGILIARLESNQANNR